MNKKIFLASLILASAGSLVSCGGTPEIFDHYFSNRLTFADMGLVNDYEDLVDNCFIEDKVAKVDLKNVTDGDTAVFYLPNGEEDTFTHVLGYAYNYVSLRFLAIDTPESTSQIQAWGTTASKYAKTLLPKAEGIILDASSINTEGMSLKDQCAEGIRFDSNGRWLAMVWYCPEGQNPKKLENYRSYQLDIIEECYSYFSGSQTSLGSNYVYYADKKTEKELYERYADTYGSLTFGDVCFEASLRMEAKEQRYTGYQKDPNFDYSRRPTDYTITEAVANFEELSYNCTFVRLTGVITSFVGTNFYFQDAEGTPMYVYMGIEGYGLGAAFKVGDTIMISGRLCMYGGQIQLSGIDWDSDDTFAKVTGEGAIPLPAVTSMVRSDLDVTKIENFLGKVVEIDVTVRSFGRISKDNSYTVYCNEEVIGLGGNYKEISIRVNGSLAPDYNREEEIEPLKGKKVRVKAVMSIYMEDDFTQEEVFPSYQLVLGNRPFDSNGNVSSDITVLS